MTKPAEGDLDSIRTYIEQDKPAAAKQIILKVIEAIEYLIEMPHIGRVGRVPHTRELIVSGTPFIVIYQVRQKTIMILRVLHAARKWPQH